MQLKKFYVTEQETENQRLLKLNV